MFRPSIDLLILSIVRRERVDLVPCVFSALLWILFVLGVDVFANNSCLLNSNDIYL